ncbi:MAG: shikimate kinase [Ignavibacteriales bacterium]|nr:shikimate kinase [Ignavibacteriales bacterium]
MGSGKSTIGPILANTIGFEYVDVDRIIEKKADRKIVDIFAEAGERAFREVEKQALQEVSSLDAAVVSLGGGTIANEENFELIRRYGVIVYLQLSPEEILYRVRRRTDRPLLKDANGNLLTGTELEARIRELLDIREQFYSRADIIIPADKKKVGATVDEIVRKLRGII